MENTLVSSKTHEIVQEPAGYEKLMGFWTHMIEEIHGFLQEPEGFCRLPYIFPKTHGFFQNSIGFFKNPCDSLKTSMKIPTRSGAVCKLCHFGGEVKEGGPKSHFK